MVKDHRLGHVWFCYHNRVLTRIIVIVQSTGKPINMLSSHSQLEKLLEQVRRLSHEGQGELPSKCALFVCNKWDQVPEEEVNEVKNHVVRNLQRCWPGLDPESQIIYMSTMKATEGQTLGIITEEVSSLMDNMRTMILKSIDARLEIHWR